MSSNSSHPTLVHFCFDSITSVYLYNGFFMTKIVVVLPLSVLILYLGHQRWQQQRSSKTTSHSDAITFHMAALELNSLVSFSFFFFGTIADQPVMAKVCFYLSNMVFPGQMCFHILTCVDRHLAVVHPVVYLGLRQSGGVRMRNISVFCVWLLSLGWSGLIALYDPDFPSVLFLFLLLLSLMAVSFCSLRVLCVLIRPGPGEVGGDEERVDQSKRRAFHTVMAIMGVLWFWFIGVLICFALKHFALSHSDGCVAMAFATWLMVPSSLVSPLLFLHRAKKLQCCHNRNE